MVATSCGYQQTSGNEKSGLDEWRKKEELDQNDCLRDLSAALQCHASHGTTAVLAQSGSPLCSVAMIFATEAKDNKGLVHCLEHLCFMGSKKYRKGYLDLFAQRCGCEGTNAYTEADHTCFELTTAGEAGLLAVLPVFVDHILCPLLSEDAFVTEIHHVNGRGERQGVVFSEMLGRVSDQEDILDLEVRRATFGNASPYSYEYGGMPDDILKLTRNEIAGYHREVYTTDNLYVVVAGTFSESKVLATLGKALDDAVAQGASQRCEKRPFASILPELPVSCPRRRSVSFPSDDVSVGAVAYSHRLAGVAFDDVFTTTALEVLSRFLTGLVSSPLEQAFVQCEPPVASGVECDINLTAEPYISIEFTGVPFIASPAELAAAKKLGGGREEEDSEDDESNSDDDDTNNDEDIDEDGGKTCEAEDDEPETDWFDGDALLERLVGQLRKVQKALLSEDEATVAELRRALKKEKVELRVEYEDGPNEIIKDLLVEHLIFAGYPPARTDGVLKSVLRHTDALESLAVKPGSWWAELLDSHLIGPLDRTLQGGDGAAEVRSCPSAKLCLQNEQKEEKEAKANAKKLGKKKLKVLQERVDAAELANAACLEASERASFPQPAEPSSVQEVPWHMAVLPPTSGGLETLEVEVPSSFVEVHIRWLVDAAALGCAESGLRPYLHLFASLLCETNVGGEDYRSVVARLDDELVAHSASVECGSEFLQDGANPCQLHLKLSAEPDSIDKVVSWADKLAHESEFTEERVLSTCKRIVTSIKEEMRSGEFVLSEVMMVATSNALSSRVRLGALAQRSFLQRCIEDVAGTCRALQKLRDVVTSPQTACSATVSCRAGDKRESMRMKLQEAWRSRHATTRPSLLCAVKWTAAEKAKLPPLLPMRYVAVGCAGSDATNVQLRVQLPTPSIALEAKKSWSLRLLCEALSMMEGPLCAAVRGKGLAYGASVSFDVAQNAVVLDLWDCSNVRKGVEAALTVIRQAPDDDEMLGTFQLDNARGSMLFSTKSQRSTPTGITTCAVKAASRGWREARELLEFENTLAAITKEDVLESHSQYLARLCDKDQLVACVVCDPSDCKKAAKGLANALGLDTREVFVKEKISDCYDLVHGRIEAAASQLPA
eukprot:TRINITY_DN61707_c0_g1_i1.p1 TRINITY_DN61707_c0_g1~~TRINITY_DN61707_c0_g1_i1.p1  ORF type:complete len:1130 (-),score=221.80 TRINITY_DN61707_c0_g1_i1:157-3519(-)